ncbi:hypothetical protein EJP77_07120 [Paenibacillus zeisoli]|uniref:Uncharacterized protein n=1 Tax=Paenibacillus zeisoli TaxID=2496267 RepID=A0A433XH66_9BACL|nr:hypothetical protein [Paenibacillus zeisoli]RUT33412.1 hypothetical protein EJP77_07120 [Paenibacillus zeisoli]
MGFVIVTIAFGFFVGFFALIFPQKFWEWLYFGLKPYNKGQLGLRGKGILRLCSVILLVLIGKMFMDWVNT